MNSLWISDGDQFNRIRFGFKFVCRSHKHVKSSTNGFHLNAHSMIAQPIFACVYSIWIQFTSAQDTDASRFNSMIFLLFLLYKFFFSLFLFSEFFLYQVNESNAWHLSNEQIDHKMHTKLLTPQIWNLTLNLFLVTKKQFVSAKWWIPIFIVSLYNATFLFNSLGFNSEWEIEEQKKSNRSSDWLGKQNTELVSMTALNMRMFKAIRSRWRSNKD